MNEPAKKTPHTISRIVARPSDLPVKCVTRITR